MYLLFWLLWYSQSWLPPALLLWRPLPQTLTLTLSLSLPIRSSTIPGASAGAMSAASLLLDELPPAEYAKTIDEFDKERWKTPWMFWKGRNHILDSDELFAWPEDFYQRCNGKLHICLTKLPFFEQVIVNHWDNNDDLRHCLKATMTIPGLTSIFPYYFKGSFYIDGGFINNHPIANLDFLCISTWTPLQPWTTAFNKKIDILRSFSFRAVSVGLGLGCVDYFSLSTFVCLSLSLFVFLSCFRSLITPKLTPLCRPHQAWWHSSKQRISEMHALGFEDARRFFLDKHPPRKGDNRPVPHPYWRSFYTIRNFLFRSTIKMTALLTILFCVYRYAIKLARQRGIQYDPLKTIIEMLYHAITVVQSFVK